jgi:alkylation response protein AidB-like acyl-CoA dehydrogenase
MSVVERGRGAGLRALTRLAGSEVLDRFGARDRAERAVFRASRGGFRTAGVAGRTIAAAAKLARPARQPRAKDLGLFDLNPDDEQALLRETLTDFAAAGVRPAASAADASAETPAELLAQAAELGSGILGVPEELGGVRSEQPAVTGALAAEALARGDMGIAFALLASGAVAGALGLWGDADQQARYLAAFAGDDPPVAALALLEARPAFDPFILATKARRDGGDWVLSGEKSLVPRASAAELLIVAADVERAGPGLFILEPGSAGVYTEPEPAMGLRPAATARLILEDVRLPASARLGGEDAEVYAQCVSRARIAWSALAVGTAQAVLDYVIPYVNERVAFGEPIANRQAVAFSVAEIGIELEAMRLATWRAAARADGGKSFAREAAVARCLSAEKGMRIAADGLQLLGGHGYVKDHPVERWYRDMRAAGVMEGALLV